MSRSVECSIHHYSCADATRRPRQFAIARKGLGVALNIPNITGITDFRGAWRHTPRWQQRGISNANPICSVSYAALSPFLGIAEKWLAAPLVDLACQQSSYDEYNRLVLDLSPRMTRSQQRRCSNTGASAILWLPPRRAKTQITTAGYWLLTRI